MNPILIFFIALGLLVLFISCFLAGFAAGHTKGYKKCERDRYARKIAEQKEINIKTLKD